MNDARQKTHRRCLGKWGRVARMPEEKKAQKIGWKHIVLAPVEIERKPSHRRKRGITLLTNIYRDQISIPLSLLASFGCCDASLALNGFR